MNFDFSKRIEAIVKRTAQYGLDEAAIEFHLRSIVQYLDENYSLWDALNAVDLKLQERYPDGFSPAASVGRQCPLSSSISASINCDEQRSPLEPHFRSID